MPLDVTVEQNVNLLKQIQDRASQLLSWIFSPVKAPAQVDRYSEEYLDLLHQRNQVLIGIRQRISVLEEERYDQIMRIGRQTDNSGYGMTSAQYAQIEDAEYKLHELEWEIDLLWELLPEQRSPAFLGVEIPF